MRIRRTASAPRQRSGLHRSLGLGLLVLYGLGMIIGAGVYVVIGDVMAQAGPMAVCSFALAGMFAGLVALSYAELGACYPEAAGACLGVKDSVRVAAVMTIIELTGLLLVISVGVTAVRDVLDHAPTLVPTTFDAWISAGAGAFLAFFAFTGFETLANMAEEAQNVGRTLPRAILLSLGISTVLYMAVALVVVAAVPPTEAVSSAAPLRSVIERRGWGLSGAFAALALVAIANGVLIQILMLARLVYSMARRSLLPSQLATVGPRHVPLLATLVAGALVLVATVALPFASSLRLSTTLTLLVFALVSLSLLQASRESPERRDDLMGLCHRTES
jgi:APA family basic amino acid/polyamine antiporter